MGVLKKHLALDVNIRHLKRITLSPLFSVKSKLPKSLVNDFESFLIRYGLFDPKLKKRKIEELVLKTNGVTRQKSLVQAITKKSQNEDIFEKKPFFRRRVYILVFLIFMMAKNTFNLLLPDDAGRILIYIGDGFHVIPGKRFFYNFPITIFGWLSTLIVILFFWGTNQTKFQNEFQNEFQNKDRNSKTMSWLKYFRFLKGETPLTNCGIPDGHFAFKLIVRCRLIFFFAQQMCVVTPLFAMLTWIIVSATRYSLWDFVFWGLPWTLVYGALWPYYCCGAIVHPFAYFHSLCYYLKLRMERMNQEFAKSRKNETVSKNLMKLIAEYHSVLTILATANPFWRNFIALIYFSYLPLNCFLLYQLIFAEIDSFIMVMLFVVLLEECGLVLTFMALSAAMVNGESKKSYQTLNSIAINIVDSKTKLKLYGLIERIGQFSQNGFYCYQFFVMDYYSFAQLIGKFGAFFLLIRQLESNI